MQGYIHRKIESNIDQYKRIFPVIAILGPRQCGKSSLARYIQSTIPGSLYLDLENQDDINKISLDPGLFFDQNHDKTIFLDEIQRAPDLFKTLRYLCDKYQKNGWIYILGSSSPDLLKQSSESLAGRIGYLELTPFMITELYQEKGFTIYDHWLKGGYPRSYQLDENDSFIWLSNYLRNFIERDILLTGKNLSTEILWRMIQMLAHSHSNVVNWSKIGDSLGINYHTVQSYCDVLEKNFFLRTLKPYTANIKKRLVKSPKLFIRDSGIFHQIIRTNTFNDLMGHQYYGASWEGYAIENIISSLPDYEYYFYRTSTGVEIDLILKKGNKKLAVEFKASSAPQPGKGFFDALEDLHIDESWIICPVNESYFLKKNIKVAGLVQFLNEIE